MAAVLAAMAALLLPQLLLPGCGRKS